MGLGLHYTQMIEVRQNLLTANWGPQLLDMVEKDSRAESMLHEKISGSDNPLVWTDLETVEYGMSREFK